MAQPHHPQPIDCGALRVLPPATSQLDLALQASELFRARIVPSQPPWPFCAGWSSQLDQMVKSWGQRRLEQLRDEFLRLGNPVHAWKALQVCSRSGIRLPDWLVRYLAKGADNIT